MTRAFLALLALVSGAAPVVAADGGGRLVGRIEDKTYVSASGAFRIQIPIRGELGGTLTDTDNVVTFQDDYNYVATVAAFRLDASQRWESSTRSRKDFLAYFFANYVMPDFQEMFRGARAESARFVPGIRDGGLIVYTLLPGGSMFASKLAFLSPEEVLPDAKRGNLIVVHGDWVYILSTEIAERILERRTYRKTTAEEDDFLRQRLLALLAKIEFPPLPAGAPASLPSAN